MDIIPEGQQPDTRPEQSSQQQPQLDKPRMTTRYLTKYERARVLGTRALQIRCALQPACQLCTAAQALRLRAVQHECAHPHRAGQQGARPSGGALCRLRAGRMVFITADECGGCRSQTRSCLRSASPSPLGGICQMAGALVGAWWWAVKQQHKGIMTCVLHAATRTGA